MERAAVADCRIAVVNEQWVAFDTKKFERHERQVPIKLALVLIEKVQNDSRMDAQHERPEPGHIAEQKLNVIVADYDQQKLAHSKYDEEPVKNTALSATSL